MRCTFLHTNLTTFSGVCAFVDIWCVCVCYVSATSATSPFARALSLSLSLSLFLSLPQLRANRGTQGDEKNALDMMDIVWEVGAAGTTLACIISMRQSDLYIVLNDK